MRPVVAKAVNVGRGLIHLVKLSSCRNSNLQESCPLALNKGGRIMDAQEFLGMILDKHHEGLFPEEEENELRGYSGKDEPLSLPAGCVWIDDVDK